MVVMEWVKPLCSEKVSEHFVRMYQPLSGQKNLVCSLGYATNHESDATYLLLWADAESIMPLCNGCTEYALRSLTLTGNDTPATMSSLSELGCRSTTGNVDPGMVHVHAAHLRYTQPVNMLWRS